MGGDRSWTHEDWQRQPTCVRTLLNELRTLVVMGLMSREDLSDFKEAYNLLPAGRAILQNDSGPVTRSESLQSSERTRTIAQDE